MIEWIAVLAVRQLAGESAAKALHLPVPGLPSLTAALVIVTGIPGAMPGHRSWTARVKDWAARGLAKGVASHGIGTAAALQVSELARAFSGLGTRLDALATSILVPALWHFLSGGA